MPAAKYYNKLFHITGRLITSQTRQDSSSATFSVASFTPGIYLYQVTTNKTTQSGKVLIGN